MLVLAACDRTLFLRAMNECSALHPDTDDSAPEEDEEDGEGESDISGHWRA